MFGVRKFLMGLILNLKEILVFFFLSLLKTWLLNCRFSTILPSSVCLTAPRDCISKTIWDNLMWSCVLIFKNYIGDSFKSQRSKRLWGFEFCGWTVHRKGLCFLADRQSRFQWPPCVSQWHGAAMRHAWEGTYSSLTSYSRFLIFAGLYEVQQQTWRHGYY